MCKTAYWFKEERYDAAGQTNIALVVRFLSVCCFQCLWWKQCMLWTVDCPLMRQR